jgi:hypothetical protein
MNEEPQTKPGKRRMLELLNDGIHSVHAQIEEHRHLQSEGTGNSCQAMTNRATLRHFLVGLFVDIV